MDNRFQYISRELIIEIDTNEIIKNISPNCYTILGYSENEMLGSKLSSYSVGNIEALFTERNTNTELILKSKQGTEGFYNASVLSKDRIGVLLSLFDISQYKERENRLKKLSYYDSLTAVCSRNYYQKQIEQLNKVEDTSFGIIVCDLDNLKYVNDSLGHEYGDKLLIKFANFLQIILEEDAIISRTGGDEFVIILKNTSEKSIKDTYTKLLKSMEDYNEHNVSIPIMASIGWAYSSASLGVVQKYFNIADSMMYENKLNKKIAIMGLENGGESIVNHCINRKLKHQKFIK